MAIFLLENPPYIQKSFARASSSIYTLENKHTVSPENWWLKNDISFWNGPFSGDMLVLREVFLNIYPDFCLSAYHQNLHENSQAYAGWNTQT